MSSVTSKELHLETKAILDRVERGQAVVITRNGRPVGRLEPLEKRGHLAWDDIMQDVWTAQKQIKDSERVPNPVLEERQRRRR